MNKPNKEREYLQIYEISTGKVEKEFDVTDKTENMKSRLLVGIETQMSLQYNTRFIKR